MTEPPGANSDGTPAGLQATTLRARIEALCDTAEPGRLDADDLIYTAPTVQVVTQEDLRAALAASDTTEVDEDRWVVVEVYGRGVDVWSAEDQEDALRQKRARDEDNGRLPSDVPLLVHVRKIRGRLGDRHPSDPTTIHTHPGGPL